MESKESILKRFNEFPTGTTSFAEQIKHQNKIILEVLLDIRESINPNKNYHFKYK